MESRRTIPDGILEEFKSLVNHHFPDFYVTNSGYGGSSFHIVLPTKPRFFRNTLYYYKGEPRFVHWTSIKNLSSIINSGELRLYNLVNSEDPDEFNFAVETLSLEPKQKEFIKDNYFTFSFCRKRELYNEHLWKIYGDEQKGVAIEFSIINNIDEWENHLVSPVYYELNEDFKKFQDDINQLKAKYHDQIKLDFDIWKLAGFHKKDAYRLENEIRISTVFPYKNTEEKLKYAKREFRIDGQRNRIVRYVPLKLWINLESPYPKDFYPGEHYSEDITAKLSGQPHLKIERIYFGCNCGLTNEEYYSYKLALEEMISFQLGYRIAMPLNLFDISNPAFNNY